MKKYETIELKRGEKLTVEKTDCFCINCGKRDVVKDIQDGDYYAGPMYYCKSCEFEFHLAG